MTKVGTRRSSRRNGASILNAGRVLGNNGFMRAVDENKSSSTKRGQKKDAAQVVIGWSGIDNPNQEEKAVS